MNKSAFYQVIKETQIRLGWFLFGFFLSSCVAYAYSEELIFFFALPMLTSGVISQFLCTQMTEAFQTYLKVSFVVSLYVNAPFFIYQIWCFLIPSYTEQQRRVATRWLIRCATFFVGGFVFAYWLAVPAIWTFFIKQCSSSISIFHFELQPRVYDYTLLFFRILFFFVLCSQMPLFVAWLIKQKAQRTRQEEHRVANAPRFTALPIGSGAKPLPSLPWGEGSGSEAGGVSHTSGFTRVARGAFIEKNEAKSSQFFYFIHRKKIFFGSICIAALLSPPDLGSQLIVLLPTYLFIEVLIFYEILLGEYNLVGQSAGL